MSGMIVFKDEDGKNVAMYQDYMVESVRKKIELEEERWIKAKPESAN